MRARPIWLVLLAITFGCDLRSSDPRPNSEAAVSNAGGFDVTASGFAAAADDWVVRVGGTSFHVSAGSSDRTSGVSFGTVAVRHGERRFAARSGYTGLDRTSLSLDRGGAREVLIARPNGLEQQWHFDAPLEGSSDLVVEIGVANAPPPRVDATKGLVFGDGDQAISYGHGTWIDARGTRTHVPAQWLGDRIALVVPASTLRSSVFPALLDPMIGPAHPVSEPVLLPSDKQYFRARIARAGSSYLVAVASESDFTTGVARVAADGSVLDRPLVTLGVRCAYPSLATNGSTYALACVTGGTPWQLAMYVITPAAVISRPTPPIDMPTFPVELAMAYGGGIYLVVWRTSMGDDLMGLRFAADGTVMGTPLVIANGPNFQGEPTVAWLGSTFYVAYSDDRYTTVRSVDLRGTTVGVDGTVGNVDGDVLRADAGFDERYPHLVASPSGALLLWTEATATPSPLRALPLAADGRLATGTPWSVGVGSGVDGVWAGSDYIVAWSDRGALVATRLDATGAMTPLAVPARIATDVWPQLAFDPASGSGLMTFHAFRSASTSTIHGAVVGPAGATGVTFTPDTFGPSAPMPPELTASGGRYLVVWPEALTRSVSFRSAPVATDGNPLGAPPPVVDLAGFYPNPGDWDVASNGRDRALVALWYDRALYRFQLDSEGRTVPPAIAVDRTLSVVPPLAIAWNGTNYLMTGEGAGRVVYRSLDGSGGYVGAMRTLAGGVQHAPDVAAFGGNFLIVWRETSSTPGDGEDVRALRFDGIGAPIDRDALSISLGSGDQTAPAVARNGDGWTVAWRDERPLPDGGVYFRTVRADGTLGAIARVDPGSAPTGHIAVAFGGRSTIIAWGGERLSATGGPIFPAATIRGVIVGPTGAIEDGPTALVADAAPSLWTPGVALGGVDSVGGDEFLIAYSAFEPRSQYPRAFTRRISRSTPLGTACATGSDCGANPCVDGVCCNDACGGGAPDCQACSVAAGAATDGVCSVLPRTHACRPALGACDVTEQCTGGSPICPPDVVASPGIVCRDSSSPCDVPETCDGVTAVCPADLVAPDGTACADGLMCDGAETCFLGACVAGAPPDCDDGDACTADSCVEGPGCMHVAGLCVDAGRADAGASDAGLPADAGASVDGGALRDASVITDASAEDASLDASSADAGDAPGSTGGGCCAVAAGGGSRSSPLAVAAIGLALVLIAARVSRRKRRSV